MKIEKKQDGENLVVFLNGQLDTAASAELEKVIPLHLRDITDLTIDCSNLEYITSAGLRILLSCQKMMISRDGKMRISNASEAVKEVLDLTHFSDILTIV